MRDAEAWRRRLVVIPFNGESVSEDNQITGLDQKLILEEGAGILMWALKGVGDFASDEQKLLLNNRQKSVRDDLLAQSETYKAWARERVVKADSSRLFCDDAYEDYAAFCDQREWSPLTRKTFTRLVTDVITSDFKVTKRHDLPTAHGTNGRGWKGIRLVNNLNVEPEERPGRFGRCFLDLYTPPPVFSPRGVLALGRFGRLFSNC